MSFSHAWIHELPASVFFDLCDMSFIVSTQTNFSFACNDLRSRFPVADAVFWTVCALFESMDLEWINAHSLCDEHERAKLVHFAIFSFCSAGMLLQHSTMRSFSSRFSCLGQRVAAELAPLARWLPRPRIVSCCLGHRHSTPERSGTRFRRRLRVHGHSDRYTFFWTIRGHS